jgi:hypothetical protein
MCLIGDEFAGPASDFIPKGGGDLLVEEVVGESFFDLFFEFTLDDDFGTAREGAGFDDEEIAAEAVGEPEAAEVSPLGFIAADTDTLIGDLVFDLLGLDGAHDVEEKDERGKEEDGHEAFDKEENEADKGGDGDGRDVEVAAAPLEGPSGGDPAHEEFFGRGFWFGHELIIPKWGGFVLGLEGERWYN